METVMTELAIHTEPPSASADGTRNSHTFFCEFTSQSMNYAACLWRQGVLSKPDIKTPADWSPCLQARNCNRCTALEMSHEEAAAGKAIYFTDRKMPPASIVKWGTRKPQTHSSITVRKPEGPPIRVLSNTTDGIHPPPMGEYKRRTGPDSMLDAMGKAGDLAAAISTADKTLPSAPRAAAAPTAPAPVAIPGESPLQMARRIAAARSASI
jgi:hypothetical protein